MGFKPDSNIEYYDESDNDIFNLHFSDEYTYQVQDSQIKCLNCPDYENEYGDIETEDVNVIAENDSIETVSVKINGKEVIQTQKGKPGLEVNKDGIIIKTK